MDGNNEFLENFERNKNLKKLPSMQRIKHTSHMFSQKPKDNKFLGKSFHRAIDKLFPLFLTLMSIHEFLERREKSLFG